MRGACCGAFLLISPPRPPTPRLYAFPHPHTQEPLWTPDRHSQQPLLRGHLSPQPSLPPHAHGCTHTRAHLPTVSILKKHQLRAGTTERGRCEDKRNLIFEKLQRGTGGTPRAVLNGGTMPPLRCSSQVLLQSPCGLQVRVFPCSLRPPSLGSPVA